MKAYVNCEVEVHGLDGIRHVRIPVENLVRMAEKTKEYNRFFYRERWKLPGWHYRHQCDQSKLRCFGTGMSKQCHRERRGWLDQWEHGEDRYSDDHYVTGILDARIFGVQYKVKTHDKAED